MRDTVMLVDRVPHPFFNGVTRYMHELASNSALAPADIDFKMLFWGRSVSPSVWKRLSRPGMAIPSRLIGWNRDHGFARAVRREKPALLHFPAHGIPPKWLEAGKRNLLSVHGAAAQVGPQWDSDPMRADKLRHTLAAARATDTHFVTFSNFARDEIVRHYALEPDRVTVIPHGVDLARFCVLPLAERARFCAAKGLENPYLLYLGPCAPRKNVEGMVQAFATARQQFGLRHDFLIAGRYHPHQSEVEKLVDRLGLTGCVKFLGPVAPADLVQLYNGAAAFAFVSRYEGFGLPVIEAMACGTPVVTSASSATGEVAGGAAMTVTSREDVSELAEALGQVLANTDLQEALRKKGLERAAVFSWQASAKAHFALYRRLIETDAGGQLRER